MQLLLAVLCTPANISIDEIELSDRTTKISSPVSIENKCHTIVGTLSFLRMSFHLVKRIFL